MIIPLIPDNDLYLNPVEIVGYILIVSIVLFHQLDYYILLDQ